MAILRLMRHGRSEGNAKKHIIQGSGPDPNNGLDSVGRRQATDGGGRLRELGFTPDVVYSSKLPRAQQTAQRALKAMGLGAMRVHEDPLLNEMCKGLKDLPGGMEGRERDTVETPEYWAAFRRDGWRHRHGSPESKGETAEEVGLRGLAAMVAIAKPLRAHERALVVTHGQLARYTIGAILGWPPIEQINNDFMMKNCGWVDLEYTSPTSWRVGEVVNP